MTDKPSHDVSAHAQDTNVLGIIERVSRDPTIDVSKLERLLDIHERVTANNKREAFQAAMARLQAKLPSIRKDGRINVNGAERSRFARLEDIDQVIRPLLAEEGFSFSFDSEPAGSNILFTGRLSHRDGHFEEKHLTFPSDVGGSKNAVQAVASSTTYARRHLIKMHLNVIETEEDDDGNGGRRPLSAEELEHLKARIKNTDSDEARFLKWVGAECLEDIDANSYARSLKFFDKKDEMVAAERRAKEAKT